jgi:hypothetical protein
MTIIDAFVDPTATDPGEPTAGEQIRKNIAGVPDLVKNLGGSGGSYAIYADRLQKKIDQAQSVVEALYSYGTVTSGTGTQIDIPLGATTVQGVEMRNTWYTISNADNVGNAIKALVADCIPCKDRVLALLSLNPMEELWNTIDSMYEYSVSFILDLYDLLLGDKSVEIFADLCRLLRFLNFMCVPDLYSMIIIMSKLVQKYTVKLKDLTTTFSSILGRIAAPAFTPLLAVIDKYIQLIVAPIECVVSSIDAEMQKLDVQQAWNKGFLGKNVERSFDLQEVAGSLQALKKYLQDAVNEANMEFEKLRKSVNDFLKLESETDKQLFNLTYHIEMATRLIGLIQAMILAVSQGAVVCGPESAGEEELKNFLDSYVNPNFDVDITFQDGAANISPSVPSEVKDLLNTLGTYKKEISNKNMPATAESKASNGKSSQLTVAQAVVPLSNCLYTMTDGELDKVKQFLGSFNEGDNV